MYSTTSIPGRGEAGRRCEAPRFQVARVGRERNPGEGGFGAFENCNYVRLVLFRVVSMPIYKLIREKDLLTSPLCGLTWPPRS